MLELSGANLETRDKSNSSLFASKGEAVVFWLSVAGLIFLLIITIFRYYSNKSLFLSEKEKRVLLSKVAHLEKANQLYLLQLDSLRTVLQRNEIKIRTLDAQLQKLKTTWKKKAVVKSMTPVKGLNKKENVRRKRDERILEEFRIKSPGKL